MLVRESVALLLCAGAFGAVAAANRPAGGAPPTLQKYCFTCHGKGAAMGGISLAKMTAPLSIVEHFQQWEKVAAALEQKRMPPEKMPQPTDAQRRQAIAWIRGELSAFARKHDGDPGRVTVRRLTSGEFAYAVQDLTGLDLNLERDLPADEVGGEGFTNFGDVQFMQEAAMERYLEVAKRIADHAVIGAGPLGFYADAGKTGFELSAVARIQEIYRAYGFRTVSGEGGRPFGLERYGKALYVAWRYRHRAALGEPDATLAALAAREGITARFAGHIWSVLNRPELSYPSSEVAARWRNLPPPGSDLKTVRAGCEEVQKFLVTWPSWLFARGDLAAGGAGDERPLEFSDNSLKVEARHRFRFLRGLRGALRGQPMPTGGTARIYLNAAPANPNPQARPVIVWRNATVQFRPSGVRGPAPIGQPVVRRFGGTDNIPRHPLQSVVTSEFAAKLNFGKSPDGKEIGPGDFASEGPVFFDVKVPDGISVFELQVDGEVGADRNQVFRVTISDRADGGTRGVPVWGLVGDPESEGYRAWKAAVLEFARILPPNSHGEPTPADKDPIPEPFDNTYNVPEHDEFVVKVKYIRDDRFVVEHVLDDATRKRLDEAWNDLYASFEYHDSYLRLLAKKYAVDLKGKAIGEVDVAALPEPMRQYAIPLRAHYEAVQAAQAAARARHLEDCLRFASSAWRRPLTQSEKRNLQAFYAGLRKEPGLEHQKAVRALLARILVAPAFLYRMERPARQARIRPLTDWELASRLSFFLWSSIPDEELRRAAAAGELSKPEPLRRQVKRMLADAKARRMATEFFGQWLGFYRFDQHRGVDTARFPEFTPEVKAAMYEEAVAFFEHIVRKDRPVREMLHADYTFLNQPLAKHYGVGRQIASKDAMEMVAGADAFHRGGLLRLGAVLTATSAPLRTSPVKRGDWVLRRVLGTPTPPPPPDAGSIPADEKLFGGLSLREKLEAHQRNPSCAGCHTRIDPLGFPLEKYDAIGRWRDSYADGKPVHDASAMPDKTEVSGVDGLLKYLDTQEEQVLRTFSQKLLGYALGRTIQASDRPLLDRLTKLGSAASFSQLAAEIAASKQFRTRREAAAPAGPQKETARR